jgi:hypothetical protein
MDSIEPIESETSQSDPLDALSRAFSDQLLVCLDECARGRKGLFSSTAVDDEDAWPEAQRLRELALALPDVFAQQGECNALCDEFLDLCSMHGEFHPGERKLARAFLARIERGEVGTPTERERRPW